eukprot:9009415-Alexandrium_andersonii.AAC.1
MAARSAPPSSAQRLSAVAQKSSNAASSNSASTISTVTHVAKEVGRGREPGQASPGTASETH